MKKCFCLLLACLLCLSVPDAFAEGAGDPLGEAFGRRYEPRIVWHPDGTVVMLTEDDGIGFFTLAVR